MVIILGCCIFSLWRVCIPAAGYGADIFVVASSDIIPYESCIEGIRETVAPYSMTVVNIREDIEKAKSILNKYDRSPGKLILAVGSQAAYALARHPTETPRLFCMVLDPPRLFGSDHLYPGVRLDIPAGVYIETVAAAFPKRTTVGVFFDPAVHQQDMQRFENTARQYGKTIIPLPVSSAQDIAEIVESEKFTADVLVIIPVNALTTKIVEYIIERSLRRSTPVVGYNRWFAQNGALIAFAVDYRMVGVQTARLAKKIIEGGEAQSEEPVRAPAHIRVIVNLKTAGKLDISISPDVVRSADEVIK